MTKSAFQQAVVLYYAKIEAYTDQAEAYYVQGAYDAAEDALSQALLLYSFFVDDPDGKVRALTLRGETAIRLGNIDNAVTYLNQVLSSCQGR